MSARVHRLVSVTKEGKELIHEVLCGIKWDGNSKRHKRMDFSDQLSLTTCKNCLNISSKNPNGIFEHDKGLLGLNNASI